MKKVDKHLLNDELLLLRRWTFGLDKDLGTGKLSWKLSCFYQGTLPPAEKQVCGLGRKCLDAVDIHICVTLLYNKPFPCQSWIQIWGHFTYRQSTFVSEATRESS